MLEWVLDRLPDEVDRVVVAVNWQADRLEQYFTDNEHRFETVVVRETEALGTGGAIKNCASHIQSDSFFSLFADIVSDMDLTAMLHQHRQTNAIATISLKQVLEADLVNFGVAAMAKDDPRRIEGFVEKPKTPALAPSRLVNAGAYLLNTEVLDLIPDGRLVSMEQEIFPQLLPRGFYGLPFDGTWIDVGDPQRMRQVSRMLSDAAWHGQDANLAADATIDDNVAGDRLRVGAGATVIRCVLGDDVTVNAGISVKDCIVGDGETISTDTNGARIWTKGVPAGYPAQQIGNAL
jgi:mannose-1-phosphate guanylyltransferase